MNIYISYGAASDQVTALRLQALGAVNGLNVYVPPAHTRQVVPVALDPRSEEQFLNSHVVLGVISSEITETCRNELNRAIFLQKSSYAMADPAAAALLRTYFRDRLLVVDPANPAQAELAIVDFLNKSNMEQNSKNALLALGTIALGLLLFAPQD